MGSAWIGDMLDVIIIGGGPAGLSAALVLGRCRRRVAVCDAGRPRNRSSPAVNGFLTRDGIAPREMLAIAREQLAPYVSVEIRDGEATDVRCVEGGGFEVVLADGGCLGSRKLLLATGVVDRLPAVEGAEAFYGRSLHHCPYCDGWAWRDRPISIYGQGAGGFRLARTLTNWSRELTLCTDGPSGLGPGRRAALDRLGIAVRQGRIARLEGRDGRLERVVFERGPVLPTRAMFFSTGWALGTDFAERLGCAPPDRRGVRAGKRGETEVPGLYVAGDASRDVQFAIVAAAEGATAAYGINSALIEEDLDRATQGRHARG